MMVSEKRLPGRITDAIREYPRLKPIISEGWNKFINAFCARAPAVRICKLPFVP